jgi:hypothetical protein
MRVIYVSRIRRLAVNSCTIRPRDDTVRINRAIYFGAEQNSILKIVLGRNHILIIPRFKG